MNDMINDNTDGTQHAFEEEEDQYGDDDDEEEEEDDGAEEEPHKPRSGNRGPLWKTLEDKCLCDAWVAVSFDPITGSNQTSGAYWKRIKNEFDERKVLNAEYAAMYMKRSQKAISNRWGSIQHDVNELCGFLENVHQRPDSGSNVADQLVKALGLFKECNKENDFKYMHCYIKLADHEKWKFVRRQLKKGVNGNVIDVDTPAAASLGRPIGKKKAKAAVAAAATSDGVLMSIDKCLTEVSSSSILRRQEAGSRWADIMQKQDKKIELETERVAVKKRKEDFALLTADTSMYDEEVRAAHDKIRNDILLEMGIRRRPPPTPPSRAATPPPEETATQTSPDLATEEPASTGE